MTTTVPLSILAAAMRASNSLLLDALADIPFGEDPLDRIIVAAVAQANTGATVEDATPQRRHDTPAAPPPDDTRQPVTMTAVAAMTGIPFETVRRRLQGLIAKDLCEVTPEGVRLPSRVAGRPENDRALEQLYELTRALHRRLTESGSLPELAARAVPAHRGPPAVRIVARLSYNHFLRMMAALVHALGDLTSALILLATLRENSEHTANLPAAIVSDGLMPDELKVPVTTSIVAEVLGLGESSVARRIGVMVADGLCLKRKGGVIVARTLVQKPEIVALLAFNYSSLLRLFEPLQQLGILARWDAEASDPAGGANAS
jgi:hypothetical protein